MYLPFLWPAYWVNKLKPFQPHFGCLASPLYLYSFLQALVALSRGPLPSSSYLHYFLLSYYLFNGVSGCYTSWSSTVDVIIIHFNFYFLYIFLIIETNTINLLLQFSFIFLFLLHIPLPPKKFLNDI